MGARDRHGHHSLALYAKMYKFCVVPQTKIDFAQMYNSLLSDMKNRTAEAISDMFTAHSSHFWELWQFVRLPSVRIWKSDLKLWTWCRPSYLLMKSDKASWDIRHALFMTGSSSRKTIAIFMPMNGEERVMWLIWQISHEKPGAGKMGFSVILSLTLIEFPKKPLPAFVWNRRELPWKWPYFSSGK